MDLQYRPIKPKETNVQTFINGNLSRKDQAKPQTSLNYAIANIE